MTAHLSEIDCVFILRFWREAAFEETSEMRWRARIRFINTGQQIHVDGVDAAFQIVRNLMDDDKNDSGNL